MLALVTYRYVLSLIQQLLCKTILGLRTLCSDYLSQGSWASAINPLRLNIHIQILQTDLHTFPYRMC